MKKLFGIICIFILTGCNTETTFVETPLAITYNEIELVEKDFEKITTILNTIKFNCGKQEIYDKNILTVTTSDIIYKFHISSNYYMEFQRNDKYCHTKEVEKVKKIILELEKIEAEYNDTTFYTIRTEKNYTNNKNDALIRLDKSNDYIIINSSYPLNNFKINEIEYNKKNDKFTDIDLLYSINYFDSNVKIIIRKKILRNPDFRISFITPYNYLITILPILNENNEINYITSITKNS